MGMRGGVGRLVCLVLLIASLAIPAAARALNQEEAEEAQLFILGNTLFTLYHELGHALIHQLDLPVLGREEDAVDHLATLMMLPEEPDEVMDRLIVAAAEGWALSNDWHEANGNDTAWWGEHSLDLQRFYSVVCLMVGSDPEGFQELADDLGLPAERQQTCPNDYAQAASGWARLLEPHLVPEDQRGPSRIKVSYANPGGEYAHLADLIRSSGLIEAIAGDIGTSFKLPHDLSLRFERCGEENAFYDPDKPGVVMCYELIGFFDQLIQDDIRKR